MQEEQYAIVSVADKSGIVSFVEFLRESGYRIISTGGTQEKLLGAGMDVIPIQEWTGSPEMLSGRVKTLHPIVHAGILARRDNPGDMNELQDRGIRPIDMVVVNLYDLDEGLKNSDVSFEDQIDIGGPTLLRAAAKNHEAVTVVPGPEYYDDVRSEIEEKGGHVSLQTRKELAADVFRRTSTYDARIETELRRDLTGMEDQEPPLFPQYSTEKLRYGSNPHQDAAILTDGKETGGVPGQSKPIHGKELSYNNYLDLDAACRVVADLPSVGCAVIKHTVPCGAAVGDSAVEAFRMAHKGDPTSAYGSVVGLNEPFPVELARELAEGDYFVEAILAPDFEDGVRDVFVEAGGWGEKVRLLPVELPDPPGGTRPQYRSLTGGVLQEEPNNIVWKEDDLRVVTGELDEKLKRELKFAWTICKHTPSNAIVIGQGTRVAGTGAGQPSRVDAARQAVSKAGDAAEGGVIASDAFFPFPDALEVGMEAGVRAAVQPGGSIRDEQVIEAAEKGGITMVLTGIRHFRH